MLAATESARQEKDWSALATIVRRVLDEREPVANQRGVRVEVQDDLPAVELVVLPVQLALLNLLSNAIKCADHRKEKPVVRISAAWADEAERNGACRICVRDNGLGIPLALQSTIFQRHFRAHPGVSDGLGLGLSIARHRLQQYSGDLQFESTEGVGSTRVVWIEGRGARIAGTEPGREDMHDLLQRTAQASLPGSEGGFTPDPEGGR